MNTCRWNPSVLLVENPREIISKAHHHPNLLTYMCIWNEGGNEAFGATLIISLKGKENEMKVVVVINKKITKEHFPMEACSNIFQNYYILY